MKAKDAIIILAILLAAAIAYGVAMQRENRALRSLAPTVETRIEWKHDTIREPVPVPQVKIVKEQIPVYLHDTTVIVRDSLILLPLETKTYATKDYRAIISGYQPRLVDLEIYRDTPVVPPTFTGTTQQPSRGLVDGIHLDLGIGAGVGYDPVTKSWHAVITAAVYIPAVRIF